MTGTTITPYGVSELRKLFAVNEAVWGTTPATPALVNVPYTNLKLNPVIDFAEDVSIYGDRMPRYTVAGNQHVTGELDILLGPGNYDNFWESAYNNLWASNVLKPAIPPVVTSQTLVEYQEDLVNYTVFTGVVVDKISVTVPSTGAVTAKLSLIGTGVTNSTTPPTGATFSGATYPDAYFVHNTGSFEYADITLGGSLTKVPDVTAFSFDIDNKLTANFTLGYTFAQAITVGAFNVSGSVTFLFDSLAHRNSFLANDVVSFQVSLVSTNGTTPKTETFLFPNVILKTSDRSSGKNGVVTETYSWVGLFDPTTGTSSQLTRS